MVMPATDRTDLRLFAVVTGGGTSGHVIPALAVLEALEDRGHPAHEMGFAGCRRGVDRSILDESGFPDRGLHCDYLQVSGLQRGIGPRALVRNLVLPWRVLAARSAARRLLRRWRPRVVVSVGGYASDPMSHAALAAGVPLVCVSYDRIPGLATRMQARRAAASAVAFAGSELPRAHLTGAPVRRSLRGADRADPSAARAVLGLPVSGATVTVVGGSLGSAVLNDAVESMLRSLGVRAGGCTVLHLCGPRFAASAPPTVPPAMTYVRRPHENRMAEVYAASDVIVCRAGASTVAEIAATGSVAVLVPWPGAADDHQRLNAAWLAESGAGLVVDEREALASADGLGGTLGSIVCALLDDESLRASMSASAKHLGAPSRGTALAELVERSAS